MEHLGSHYIVLLNEPKLRAGLAAEAEQSPTATQHKPRASVRLRFRLGGVLRALAVRIEPGSRQPVFVD